jgi:cephalosporin hydroxylase
MMPNKPSTFYRKLVRWQASISKRLFWQEHLKEAEADLRQFIHDLPTTEMMLAIPFMFRGKGYYRTLGLKQNMLELRGLVEILRRDRLDTICEIGTFLGGTLFIWCRLATPNARLISIDLPGGGFGGGYYRKSIPFFQSFCKQEQTLQCLRGSSHDPVIRNQFRESLGDRLLDYLFIDGDHSYEGVKQDFDFYAPFVKTGGIIALHDIVYREAEPDIRVHQFWNEVKKRYRHEEFIDGSSERRPIGIGILYMG